MFFDPPRFTIDPRPFTLDNRLGTLDPPPKGKLFLDFCVKVNFCCRVDVTSVTYVYLTGLTCANIIQEIVRTASVQRIT